MCVEFMVLILAPAGVSLALPVFSSHIYKFEFDLEISEGHKFVSHKAVTCCPLKQSQFVYNIIKSCCAVSLIPRRLK